MKRLRRKIPEFLLLALLIAVGVYLLYVFTATRTPENYSEIEEGLYLGGRVKSPPPDTEVVLNVCLVKDDYQADMHKWEPIKDGTPAPALDWLRDRVEFVDKHRDAGKTVYVHCLNGVSRSGMVVVAYLMYKHGWRRDRALAFVRSKRAIVRPNPAFMELLLEWEKEISANESVGTDPGS